MFKHNRAFMLLAAALLLGSTVLATPASAETRVVRDGNRIIRVSRPNRKPQVVKLRNGNIIRVTRPHRRTVKLPNGKIIVRDD
jgi:hypothetical protein